MPKQTYLEKLALNLRGAGYEARRPELLSLHGFFHCDEGNDRAGARAMLLEGPPGVGKTFFSEAVAEAFQMEYLYHLLHSWSDDQELFMGVDIPAAVAGDAEKVRQPGILARAAAISKDKKVVVCLDEIDKTEERCQNLLLDVLQTGRVPLQPGVQIQGKLSNMFFFITTNQYKPLSDALMRRVRRLRMIPLPVDAQDKLVAHRTGLPMAVCRTVSKAGRSIAAAEGNPCLSLQEIVKCVKEAHHCSQKIEDLREILAAWCARTDQGINASKKEKLVGDAWAEIKNHKIGRHEDE